MGQTSKLLAFYRGGPDDGGRRLADILQWDRDRLELTHDYIQWMFPLRESSLASPSAPVLSANDVREFRSDPAIQAQMVKALDVMRAFYGFETGRSRDWLQRGNHNYLRLTRMLRSLRTVGLEGEARRLFADLSAIYHRHAAVIGETTFGYWQRAMTDDVGI